MKKESPLWSSISLLIGIVIAILALARGRMLLPLLLAVFALWLLWWLLTQALPLWRNNRAYRAKEARLREQTAAANGGGQLADALLCHVNYRITAMLRAAYPNARWEWLADKPSRFAVEGGILDEGTPLMTYTFKVDGAQWGETQIVATGDTLYEPATPTAPAGMRFAGWVDASDTQWYRSHLLWLGVIAGVSLAMYRDARDES